MRGGFFLGLVGTLLAATAQANTWQPLGPEGANVIAVVDVPFQPNLLWAIVHNRKDLHGYRSGLRRSTDAGLTWADEPMPGASHLRALSLHIGDLFVLGSSGQIQRRFSDTGSWEIVQPPQEFVFRTAVFMGPKRINETLVVAYEPDEYGQPGGLAMTRNQGATWQNITPPGAAGMQPIAMSDNGFSIAYEGNDGTRRVWVRDAQGVWIRADHGLPAGRITLLEGDGGLLFAAIEGVGVFSNRVWEEYEWKRADNGFATPGPVHVLARTRGQFWGLFAGTDRGLHLTRWYGLNWTLGVDGTRGQSIRAINATFPFEERVTLGAYPAGILISTDEGASFEALSQGLYDRPTLSVAGNPANPRELLTVVDDEGTTRLMRSRDIGENWDMLTGVPRHAQQVLYSPDASVYLVARPSRRGAGGATVYRQQPNGRWIEGVLPGAQAEGATVTRLVFSQHAAGRVWAVGADGHGDQRRASLWRSDDAGISWVQVWLADDAHTAMELMPVHGSGDQGLLMVVRRSGFLTTLTRSTDGGATWFDFNEGLEGNATRTATCVFAHDPGTAYAQVGNSFDNGSIYQRNLAAPGAAWTPVVTAPSFFQRFICDDANPGTFYASWTTDMGAGIRKVTLGGQWEALGEHQILPPSRIDEMVRTPAGLFIASERGVLRLAQPAQAPAPANATVGALSGRAQRIVQLHWNAGGEWVDVYRDGERVASMRNTGHFSERLLRTGQSPEYQVCNAFSEGCSEPVTLAP